MFPGPSRLNSVPIAEDKSLIRMNFAEVLEDARFQALEADTTHQALNVREAHPQIEAIFTDIDMPGSKNGLKLAKVVHEVRSDMVIILTTEFLKVAKHDLPSRIFSFRNAMTSATL